MIRFAGAITFAAGGAMAQQAVICDGSGADMAGLCGLVDAYCVPYLDDPASLHPDTIQPVPSTFQRYFENQLNSHVLGYRETATPQTLVVYTFDEPACEILAYGLDYSDLLPAYADWRSGPGSRFAATTEFEPKSRISMARAFAATFLAAPRADGRVTEVTFNWNLNFEGLTRLRVSYQPLRDHTADLMGVALK